MTYNEAIIELNKGNKVSRWVNQFLFHAHPLCEITIIERGVEKQVNASSYFNLPYKSGGCFCIKTETEIIVGWQPTDEDKESKDWKVV